MSHLLKLEDDAVVIAVVVMLGSLDTATFPAEDMAPFNRQLRSTTHERVSGDDEKPIERHRIS